MLLKHKARLLMAGPRGINLNNSLSFGKGSQWSKALLRKRNAKLGFMVSYLVDPASSHMLVSKIKPCMSKYKLLIR